MTFTEQLNNYPYSKKELILSLFTWSYKHDQRLYYNLDKTFEAFVYRNGIQEDIENGTRYGGNKNIDLLLNHPNYSPEEVMLLALSMCDYHDSRRFMWTFTHGGRNGLDPTRYDFSEKHRYSFMIDAVKARDEQLQQEGLLSFRKSRDYEKHSWLRKRLTKYMNNDMNDNSSEILICYGGNNLVNQIFRLNIRKEFLQYVLDNNVVNDPFTKDIIYRPFGFKDYRNGNCHKIYNLIGNAGGLIYLTTMEILEIYKAIPRHKVPTHNKAAWAYIQSMAKNNFVNAKFYINIED